MEIKSAEYLISSPSVDKCPKPDRPEYAFIGRSNVGKSSLINMICNKQKLAKTSAEPGKTQLINHYEIVSTPPTPQRGEGKGVRWYLVDLPGYGFAVASQKQRKSWGWMIENYIRKRETLVNLFVLIDCRHLPQKIDLDFVNNLGQWKIPFALVFTKADKNKPAETTRHVAAFLKELQKTWEEIPPYFITSATKKTGRNELLLFIGSLNARV